jgi:aminoglycoside 6'-N-acetyltransferase I
MNAANVLVRLAKPSDLGQLASLREALWPESIASEHAEELSEILAGKLLGVMPLVVFVAEAPNDPKILVGFLEAGLRSCADGCDVKQPVGYVEGWYVSDSHRRQGIGAALLRAAEDWARAQGCREIASDTQITNILSQRVHESLGFQVAERAILYRKPL